MKDSLARVQTTPAMTPGQLEALGARAGVDHQTLELRLSQVDDPTIRAMVVAVAEDQFGRVT